MTVPKIDNLNAEGLGHLREELEHFDINEVHRAVSDRFESQAAKTPNNTALKSRTQSITYSQLNKRANKLAHAILSSENAKSAAIASLFGHEINSITGLLGILKSGNIFVPLDSTYNPERISFSLEDSLATIIVTNDANLEQAQSLKRPGQQIINVDHMDANLSEENLGLEISAESSALIMYTSGSTGKPKGVVSDHRKLNHRAHYFEPDEKLTHLLSISFIASFDDILGALMSSATLYLYDIKHEGLIPMADWLIEEKITYFRLPSAMLRKFNDYLNVKMRFPDILRISLGGQAVFTQDAKRLLERCSPGCIAKIAFASTEAGRIAQFHFTLKTKIESDVLPVGFPAIGMDINIIDKMGKSLGPNQEGEIVITSSYLAKEYWRDPELTKKIFLPAPEGGDKRMMYTGDIGVMREDGLLELKGRKDFRVKIRGYRIEVSAIEAHLQKFDSVKEVVVASQESSRGGDQYLVAYIVPQGNSMPTVRSLRDSMATKFANFMIPARFVYMKKIPLTASGKIDRKLLPAPAPERPDLGNAFVAPSDKFQKKLAKIWEDILAIKPVGIYDNFFDLGGDSLIAAQLFVEIERTFGRKLPLSILYSASNVHEQANILRNKDLEADWSPLIKVQSQGSQPPLFCFPGKGGNPIRFRHLSQRLGNEQPVYMLQSHGLSGTVAPFDSMQAIVTNFLNAMQEVQPHGPYYLVGSSFGGKVAYEIAQQLLSRGEKVDLLAFIDTYGPGYPERLPSTNRMKMRVYQAAQYIGKHIGNMRVAGWKAKTAYLNHYLGDVWRRTKNLPKATLQNIIKPILPKELVEVEEANLMASRSYKVQPYPGKVILFRAEQQPWGIYDNPTLGWGDVGIEELVIIEIPGHHGSILFEPRVGEIVGILKGLLE